VNARPAIAVSRDLAAYLPRLSPKGATASQLSLGYEPYNAHLRRPAWSLVAALTSADGRRAFMPGPQLLPHPNSSRRVSCTNSCTNQPPGQLGCVGRHSCLIRRTTGTRGIRRRSTESVRSVRRDPYQQVRVLPIVWHRRHNPVPSGQSVRKLREITALARRAKPTQWDGLLTIRSVYTRTRYRAHFAAGLPRCCSLMRSRRRR
jgi:hypothetical protein